MGSFKIPEIWAILLLLQLKNKKTSPPTLFCNLSLTGNVQLILSSLDLHKGKWQSSINIIGQLVIMMITTFIRLLLTIEYQVPCI